MSFLAPDHTACVKCNLLCADAQKAGYQALVVTVDAPRLGSREADERNRCAWPLFLTSEGLAAAF